MGNNLIPPHETTAQRHNVGAHAEAASGVSGTSVSTNDDRELEPWIEGLRNLRRRLSAQYSVAADERCDVEIELNLWSISS
jgi:hypothetical protein